MLLPIWCPRISMAGFNKWIDGPFLCKIFLKFVNIEIALDWNNKAGSKRGFWNQHFGPLNRSSAQSLLKK